ncbi:unnamed protein product [Schistosoma mattheei]|uniref:Uncharacterized protein n=1 Tax=Schistosoma mattheei TaxID=31246 RepID=A0A183P5U5_9TREM|nr:unnamed protein product [Schistosoma mattheei]
MIDVVYLRDKSTKRDIRLYNALIFLKSNFWKNLFNKEADELERDGIDENIFYMIEHEPIVNRFTRFTYEEKDEKRKTSLFNINQEVCVDDVVHKDDENSIIKSSVENETPSKRKRV